MRVSTKEILERALRAAVMENVISQAEYEQGQREVGAVPVSQGSEGLELGGYPLIEFLYARAYEAGEEPPKCAREWREVEWAIAGCGPDDRERLSILQSRSVGLAAECREFARRWSEHHEFDQNWA